MTKLETHTQETDIPTEVKEQSSKTLSSKEAMLHIVGLHLTE